MKKNIIYTFMLILITLCCIQCMHAMNDENSIASRNFRDMLRIGHNVNILVNGTPVLVDPHGQLPSPSTYLLPPAQTIDHVNLDIIEDHLSYTLRHQRSHPSTGSISSMHLYDTDDSYGLFPLTPQYSDYKQASDYKSETTDRNLAFLCPLTFSDTSLCPLTFRDTSKKTLSSPLEQKIKDYMRLSITCKQFNNILNFETIGRLCEQYPQKDKDDTLRALMNTINNDNFYRKRLSALALLCAGADANTQDWQKNTLLEKAIIYEDNQLINLLFKHHVNPNIQPDYPFIFHVKNIKMAEMLIKNGVNVHTKYTLMGKNILHKIVDNEEYSSDLLAFYLKHGVDATQLDRYHESCLHHLADTFHKTIKNIDDFLHKGKLLLDVTPEMINSLNKNGATPLDLAQKSLKRAENMVMYGGGTPKAFEQLIALFKQYGGKTAKELKRDAANMIDENGETELIRATKNNALKKVVDLLACGADTNIQDKHHKKALDYARSSGIFGQLLRSYQPSESEIKFIQSIRATENEHGQNLLHVACRKGDINSIDNIFHQRNHYEKYVLLFMQDDYGWLPIHEATANGHTHIVNRLLDIHQENFGDCWALISHRFNNMSSTPLHFAVAENHVDMVKSLLAKTDSDELTALLFMENKHEKTSLVRAIKNGYTEIVTILLDAAGNSAHDLAAVCNGRAQETALHYTIKYGQSDILKLLIQRFGYDILQVKNKYGKTAFDYAMRNNHENINAILAPLLTCTICLETQKHTDLYAMKHCNGQSGCNMNFCKECLLEHITTHLHDGSTRELKCPNSTCAQKMNEPDIRAITKNNNDLYLRFLDISFDEYKLHNQQHIKSCPTPDCNCTYSIEGIQGTQRLRCPGCYMKYCMRCQYDHPTMSCEQAATRDHDCLLCATRHARNMSCGAAARNRAQENNMIELSNQKIKSCPQCKTFIEKNKGCNHMTCKKCSHEFCWTCLSTYRTTLCDPSRCALFDLETGYDF